MPKAIEIDFNKVYKSNNFGDFIILRECPRIYRKSGGRLVSKRCVDIQFIKTGYIEKEVLLSSALRGDVKDPYYPTVFGVGYHGKATIESVGKRIYVLWYNMLSRCYNVKDIGYERYGGIGIAVEERWHCLEYFAQDIQYLPNFNEFYNHPELRYELDKDELQINIPKNQRVYSRTTCKFSLTDVNSRLQALNLENKTSKYFGVHKRKQSKDNSYIAAITINAVKYYLGSYDNEDAAANVYNFVLTRCTYGADTTTLNKDVPYMDIHECMKHLTSKRSPDFPPGINKKEIEGIEFNNKTSKYVGVRKADGRKTDAYCSYYSLNGKTYDIGTFTSEIAAANAHNWYIDHLHITSRKKIYNDDVPYMPPEEWLKYKTYAAWQKSKRHGEMCHIVKKQMCHIVEK